MKHIYLRALNDTSLIQAIESAKWRVHFYAPGVSQAVAEALIQKKETFCIQKCALGKGLPFFRRDVAFNFRVVLDVSEESIKLGYGDAKAIQALWECDTEYIDDEFGRWLYHASNLRIGLLIVDNTSILFSPIARLMESQSLLEKIVPNGIVLPYELLLKSYQLPLVLMRTHLVTLADINRLISIPVKSREEIEEKVKTLEKITVEQRKELEKVKSTLSDKEEMLQQANKVVDDIENPPVKGIELSLAKFDVSRLVLKMPAKFLKQVDNRLDPREVDLRIKFDEESLSDSFRKALKDVQEQLDEIRKFYVLRVKYLEDSFVDKNKKEYRYEAVFLSLHEDELRGKIKALFDIVTKVKKGFENELREKVKQRVRTIFPELNHICDDELFGCFSELGDFIKKFNPHLEIKIVQLNPYAINSDSFKIGLFNAFAKKYEAETKNKSLVSNDLNIDCENLASYKNDDKIEVVDILYHNYKSSLKRTAVAE